MTQKIINNIGELLTCPADGNKDDLGLIKNAALIIEDDIIKDFGPKDDLLAEVTLENYELIDAKNKPVLPGFIDPHTHFIFGGYRDKEFNWRLQGISYEEIMERGGGIVNTVEPTRKTSLSDLKKLGINRLNNMLEYGVTTVEGKSGYGLNLDTELKQLKVMKEINDEHPLDIALTFMGAHATPQEYSSTTDYVDHILTTMLPEVAEANIAEFCDIFCDKGAFTIEQSRKILKKAKKLGFQLKIHADEIASIGGAELAAEVGAISAEHLLKISDRGIEKLAKNKVIPVLLPITAFSLKSNYAPARKMIDNNLEPALATDFNPGSCFSESIPLLLSLATLYMGMTPEEAVRGITINAARAINREDKIGSIKKGKKADLVLLSTPSYTHLTYHIGHNCIDSVIKNGELVFEK